MGGEKLPAMNGGNFNHFNTVAPKEEKVFPLFNNTGKTAIVSGAGAGIGLTVAQALAESGANVAIWYHGNKKALDRAHDIEKEYGVKCMCNVGTKTLTNAVAADHRPSISSRRPKPGARQGSSRRDRSRI